MNHKLLFLDIDGVLNSDRSRIDANAIREGDYGTHRAWLPDAVEHLKRVIAETHCDIVISSDWRLPGNVPALQEGFTHFQIPQWVGMTPDLHMSNRHNGGRGREIEAFLQRFTAIQADGHFETVASHAIVDDNPWMLPSQAQVFVKTDPWFGLTGADADRLIQILNHA